MGPLKRSLKPKVLRLEMLKNHQLSTTALETKNQKTCFRLHFEYNVFQTPLLFVIAKKQNKFMKLFSLNLQL
ncbi:hypothetical protein Fmac_002323 [Flemingia macrophylla]|uniref:Uncharacterized protein n=1 Tax=Flemingia macrophylla TaxID=520843 RepID=A0ABD1NKD6_9FABA